MKIRQITLRISCIQTLSLLIIIIIIILLLFNIKEDILLFYISFFYIKFTRISFFKLFFIAEIFTIKSDAIFT